MDVGEKMRGGRLARFTHMDHGARPRRVAFMAVPRVSIVGRFEALRRGRQLAVGLEPDAGRAAGLSGAAGA